MVTPQSKIILNDDNCDAIEFARPGQDVQVGIRSSMAPTIIHSFDGRSFCSIGSKGSQKIPQGIAQVLINRFVHGMSWEESVAAPRVYFYGGITQYEAGNFISGSV